MSSVECLFMLIYVAPWSCETQHFVPLYVHTCSGMTIKLNLNLNLNLIHPHPTVQTLEEEIHTCPAQGKTSRLNASHKKWKCIYVHFYALFYYTLVEWGNVGENCICTRNWFWFFILFYSTLTFLMKYPLKLTPQLVIWGIFMGAMFANLWVSWITVSVYGKFFLSSVTDCRPPITWSISSWTPSANTSLFKFNFFNSVHQKKIW